MSLSINRKILLAVNFNVKLSITLIKLYSRITLQSRQIHVIYDGLMDFVDTFTNIHAAVTRISRAVVMRYCV